MHDDWTVLSFDRDRDTYVLRQFNSEGYVNTFPLDAASSPPERMIFVLEASENARGTRATLTRSRVDADTFDEVFGPHPARRDGEHHDPQPLDAQQFR